MTSGEMNMNYLDLVALIAGTSIVMTIFVAKTNLEEARIKIRVRAKK